MQPRFEQSGADHDRTATRDAGTLDVVDEQPQQASDFDFRFDGRTGVAGQSIGPAGTGITACQ